MLLLGYISIFNMVCQKELDNMKSRRKRILLLCAGGTIACRPGRDGLCPALDSHALLSHLESMTPTYDIHPLDLFSLDSSNIQPEHWQTAARCIYQELSSHPWDGIVLTHGTDTMGYTAAMLSYMLENPPVPIVLTGSQLPLEHALTDGYENLRCAFAMAASGVPGVFVAFQHRIILGTRAVKTRSSRFDAFESVNLPPVGTVSAAGLRLEHHLIPAIQGEFALRDNCNDRVFLIKLTPGIRPEVFRWLAKAGYRGLVIETFGAGGMAFLRRNLVECLGEITAQGIPVAAVSQCLYDGSDLSIYESGRMALQNGIWGARDMTTEAAVTKMMWCLGQETDDLRQLFFTPRFGEIAGERSYSAG